MRDRLYDNLKQLANPQQKAEQSGKLGNFAGTVKVPNRPNYVYVRLSDNTVAECWNTRVPPIPNLNVLVATNPRKKTELMVTDIILNMQPTGIGGLALPAHHETHTWPEYDTVYVDYRQIIPLRVSPIGGLSISINGGWYLDASGTVSYYNGETQDLTSYAPAYNAKIVTVSLSPTGAIEYTDSGILPYFGFDWKEQTPKPPIDNYPLAAIRLVAGKGTIVDNATSNNDVQDLRFIPARAYPNNPPNLEGVDYIQFDTTYTGTYSVGRIQWNGEEETFDVGLNDGVVGQMFLEDYFDYKNQTGSTITNGTPLMFDGALGSSGVALVQLALADGSLPPEYIMGISTHDCENGELGKATWRGKVRHIDTTGAPYGETWNDGDLIYVSPFVAGNLTNIEPVAPNRRILIAAVMRAHTNGTLLLRPTWTPKLSELDDVDGLAPTKTGDLLTWNDASGTYMQSDYNITDYHRKDESIEIPTGSALYFGASTTEGTWRIIRTGDNLAIQRFESSVWVDKTIITP